ncbi:MAG: hypothetical protein ABL983_00965 [Nitrospira sp.]
MEVLANNLTDVTIPEKPLLRFSQREGIQTEVGDIEEGLNPSNPFKHRAGPDIAEARNRVRRLKGQLKDYSPPELTGGQRDKLVKRIKELEDKILPGMPTQEEMRKNPAGMVGRHMRFEKANKKAILEWKNAQIMLDPTSNDPDLANFERLRPSGEVDRFRGDAQINGLMSYGNIPQELWDLWAKHKPNSALEQAKKVAEEQKGMELKEDVKIDKRKLPRTEEQKRALADRLAKARAAQSKAKDPVSPQEGESVPFEGA